MRARLLPLFAVVLVCLAGGADAGGIRDLDDAWLVSGSRTSALLERGSGRGQWLEARLGRLYGMPALRQVGLGWWWDGPRWELALLAEQLGRDLYRERTLRARLAVGRSWRLGAEGGQATLTLGSGPGRTHRTVFAWLRGPVGGAVRLGVRWPIARAAAWFAGRGYERWLWLEGDTEAASWSLVVDRRDDGRPGLQFELMFALGPGAAGGVRVDAGTGSLGFVVALRAGGALLRSGHLAHPELGVSHRWSLGYRP
ncbi:hypothetical protein GF314_15945 [bacterium]|nr:hypothetical protein [bacterium]